MATVQGRLTNLGIGKESDWATAVSTTTTIPLVGITVFETSGFEDSPELHQGAGGTTRRREELGRDVGGSLEGLLTYRALGLLIEGGAGQVGTTGAGPTYTHAFTHTDLAALPSYTLRGRWGNTSNIALLPGCMINAFKIMWKARAYTRFSADIIGKLLESFDAGSPGTTTIGDAVLPQQAGDLTWNSVDYDALTSAELEVNNNLTRLAVIGSLYTIKPVPSGDRLVRLKASALLDADGFEALIAARQAGTRSNATWTFTGQSSQTFGLTIHNAQVVEGPTAHPTAKGPLEVSWTWAATDDGSGYDGAAISIVNAQSSYAS